MTIVDCQNIVMCYKLLYFCIIRHNIDIIYARLNLYRRSVSIAISHDPHINSDGRYNIIVSRYVYTFRLLLLMCFNEILIKFACIFMYKIHFCHTLRQSEHFSMKRTY